MNTPQKEDSIGDALTPVRFLDSPKLKLSDAVATRSRLDNILQSLLDNYNKWQLAQRRGLALCQSIEAVKTRNLEGASMYPNELHPYCQKLAVISGICVDITSNAREALKQLRALTELPGNSEVIIYRTWPLSHYATFLVQLLHCYEQETLIKQSVTTNIAHCTSRAELIRFTCGWEYPQYVDEWTALAFALLREELSSKQ